ncbi:uncharacterized protein LOC141898763 [Tubulanus polymorphus]|uniref:uncharacterized protein LOC141898763 n=1 Tax=Tubulanus polymorphus TaxID=672921 RepID=UPI003DA56EB0
MHNNIDTFNPLDVLAAAAALQSATTDDGETADDDSSDRVTRSRRKTNSDHAPQVKRSRSFVAGNHGREQPSRGARAPPVAGHRVRTRSNNESRVWFSRRTSCGDPATTGNSCYLDHSYANFVAFSANDDKTMTDDLNGDDDESDDEDVERAKQKSILERDESRNITANSRSDDEESSPDSVPVDSSSADISNAVNNGVILNAAVSEEDSRAGRSSANGDLSGSRSLDSMDLVDQSRSPVATDDTQSHDRSINNRTKCPFVNCEDHSLGSAPSAAGIDDFEKDAQNDTATVKLNELNGVSSDTCDTNNSPAANDLKHRVEVSKTNQCQLESELETCVEGSVAALNNSALVDNCSSAVTPNEERSTDNPVIDADCVDSTDSQNVDDENVANDTCSNCAENVENLDDNNASVSNSSSIVDRVEDKAMNNELEEPKPPDGDCRSAELPHPDVTVSVDDVSSLKPDIDTPPITNDSSVSVDKTDLTDCNKVGADNKNSPPDKSDSTVESVTVSAVPGADSNSNVNDSLPEETEPTFEAPKVSLNDATSSSIVVNNVVSPVRTHPIIRALPTSPLSATRMLGTVIPGQRPMIAVPVIAVPVNKNVPSAGTILTPRLAGQTFTSVNQTNMGTILVPTTSTVQNPVVNPARRTNLFKGAQSSSLGFAGSFQLVTGNVGSTSLTTLNGGIIDDLSGTGKIAPVTDCRKNVDDNNEIIDVVSPADASLKVGFSSPNKFSRYRLTPSLPESPITPVPFSSVQTTPTESSANVSPEIQSDSKTNEIAELIQASATATAVPTVNKSALIKPVPQIVQTFTGLPTTVSMQQLNNNGISSLYQSELAQQLLRAQNRPVGRPPKERNKYKVSSARSRIEGVRPLSHHAATQIHENLRPHPLRDHDYCLHSFYQVVAFTKQEEKREIKEEKEQKKLEEKQEKKKKKELLRLKKMRESESSKSRKYKRRIDKNKKKKKKLSLDSSETSDFSPEKLIKSEPGEIVNFELGGEELKFETIDTSSEMAASDSIKSEPSSPGSFYGKESRSLRKKEHQQSLRMRNDDRVKITGTSSFQNQFVFYATKKPRRRARPDVDNLQTKGIRPSNSAEFLPGLDATYLEAKAKFVAAQQKKEENLINPPKYPVPYLDAENELHNDDVFSSIPTSSGNAVGNLTSEIDHLDLAPDFNPSIPKGKLAVGVTEEESNFLETLCNDVHGHAEPNHAAADLSQELDNMGFNLTPEQVKEFLATFGVEKAAKLLTGDPDLKIATDHQINADGSGPSEVAQDISTSTISETLLHNPPMLSGMSTNSDVLINDTVVTSSPVPTTDVTHSLPTTEAKEALHQPSELGADLANDSTPHDLFDLDTSDLFSECVNINSILNFQSPEKSVNSSQGYSSITKTRKLDFEGIDDKSQIDMTGAGDASNSTNFSKSDSVSSISSDHSRSTAIHNHPQGNNFTIGKPESMFKSQFMKKLVSDAPEVTDPGVPDLIMVNMFWNDLPGLYIKGKEYVRLVDIHKQVLPAKPTGLLKNRCRALNLEFTNSTELQRDFLIRYAHAAASRSTLIVTKEVAEILIGYYVNPPPRASRTDIKDEPEEDVDSDDEMSIPASSITSNEEIGKGKRKRGGTLARWQRRRKQQRLARQRKNNVNRRPEKKKPIKLLVNLKEAKAAIKGKPSSPEKTAMYLESSDSDVNTATSSDSDDTTDRLEQIRKLRNRAKYLRSEILKVGRKQRSNSKTKIDISVPGVGFNSVSKDNNVIRIKAPKSVPVTKVVSVSGNNGKSPLKVTGKGVKINNCKKADLTIVKPSFLSTDVKSTSKIITVSKPSLNAVPVIINRKTSAENDRDTHTKTDVKSVVDDIPKISINSSAQIENDDSDNVGTTNERLTKNETSSENIEDEVVLLKEEPTVPTCKDVDSSAPVETDETENVNKKYFQSPVNICRTLQQASVDEIEVIELSDEYTSPKKCAPSSPENNKTATTKNNSRIMIVEHYDNPLSENVKQNGGCSQIGELRLDLYGTKTAQCLKCVECDKFFSVNDFLEHLHSRNNSQQLADVLVPQKLRLLNAKPTLQDAKRWKEFQIRQKRFNGSSTTQQPNSATVRAINFDESKSSVHDRTNSTGSLNGGGTRQSKRARKPKQLFSFEKYVFPDVNSSASKTTDDESFIDDIDESLLVSADDVAVDSNANDDNSATKRRKSEENFINNGDDSGVIDSGEIEFKKPQTMHNVQFKTANVTRRRSEGQTLAPRSSEGGKRHARSKSSPELSDASPAKKRKVETSPLSPRTSARRASLIKTRYKR